MGKRATVTQVVHSAKNRDGFIEDAFWGSTGGLLVLLRPPARILPPSLPPDRYLMSALPSPAPKAIARLPAAIDAEGRDHLRAALGLAVRHLEGREVEEEDIAQVGEELLCGVISVLVAAVKSSGLNPSPPPAKSRKSLHDTTTH